MPARSFEGTPSDFLARVTTGVWPGDGRHLRHRDVDHLDVGHRLASPMLTTLLDLGDLH